MSVESSSVAGRREYARKFVLQVENPEHFWATIEFVIPVIKALGPPKRVSEMHIHLDSGIIQNLDALAAVQQLEPEEREQYPVSTWFYVYFEDSDVGIYTIGGGSVNLKVSGTDRTRVYGLAAVLEEKLKKRPSATAVAPPPAAATQSPAATPPPAPVPISPPPGLFHRVSYHPVGGPVLVAAIVGFGTWLFAQLPSVAAWLATAPLDTPMLVALLSAVAGVATAIIPWRGRA